ncbi:cob(I)yrinic acid a,c-diamide adenosyltransferase [Ignavibacteria bacterium 4148-Me]|uniref:cob(I)yrinic acid a,c-diamide adenosyltransferase n=1 Tax=Rosettibacter primus TaxID=3111523 RepID=UPI00336BBDBD
MKIYTKQGDGGKTSLLGGEKVWKDNQRIKAYGTVDELNAILGIVITESKSEELIRELRSIQSELFTIGADLATPNNKSVKIVRTDENFTKRIENLIDKYDEKLPELKNFILPGGSKAASYLHLARTVCRRAEREVVSLIKEVEINPQIEVYLNRLSDLLFVLARYENYINGIEDIKWNP